MESLRNWKYLSLAVVPLVFLAGCKKQPPIQLACNATPPAVFPGEPVTLEAKADQISTKKHTNVLYNWSGNGVSGNEATAKVATDNLAPGSYTANAEVKEGKKGKEGKKPGQSATCSTTYKVKEFEPPTLSCSANPSTVMTGGTSTISCTGASPQNRPLTYSYTASAGKVSGQGATATFSSTGAPTGPATVNCTVQDDKNHTATAEATVTVMAPPPPPTPHVQALCTESFEMDKKRPTRVNNEAKACLDEVALNLQQHSDAKLVLVADSTAKEKDLTAKQEARAAKHKHAKAKVEHFAEQRGVNAKDYLVKEKGIDPSRITVTTSTGDDQNVKAYLVPSGANVEADVPGLTPVSESSFTPETRKPLAERHHKHSHK